MRRFGVETTCAYQELSDVPVKVDGRAEPWGNGHAMLACDGLTDGSFAVINADDYSGKNRLIKASSYLPILKTKRRSAIN